MHEGYVDRFSGDFIEGWAWDRDCPDTPVALEIFADENLIARVNADRFRLDLFSLQLGNGEHGFHFAIPDSIRDGRDHIISVEYEKSGLHLAGSPVMIPGESLRPRDAPPQENMVSCKPLPPGSLPCPADLADSATKAIRNLGELLDSRYAGIFTIIPDQDVVDLYLHDEFRSGASAYDKKNANPAYYTRLMTDLTRRLEGEPFNRKPGFYKERLRILDIGSGSGNSVYPILDFFSASRIIASDLSPDMLLLLKNNLAQNRDCGNLVLMQLNAEDIAFREDSFDIVFGFSILHHLFSPEIALAQCSRVLKKGGLAIFFEPFASGHGLLRDVCEEVLADSRSASIPPRVVSLLRAQVLFFDVQKGTDKSLSCFRHIEDKWVFAEDYFSTLAASCGFSGPVIYNINPSDKPLENKLRGLEISLQGRDEGESLPDWAWEIVRRHDAGLADSEKASLLFEGCVIFWK